MSQQPAPAIRQREPRCSTERLPADWPHTLKQLLAARDIGSPRQLDHSLSGLLPPHALKGIDQAAALLADAVQGMCRVCVVGDFDADGATASALCLRGLRSFGLDDVEYVVPNRFDYGYGLSTGLVATITPRAPRLIVTVDNGIASNDGVAAARAAGIDVIITDHHLPGPHLPPANAIVNPNLADCEFPSKSLAGVGVLFYLLVATRSVLQARGHFTPGHAPNLARWLDLVALGTVADLVPLDDNNRILVAQGLARIRAGKASPGVTALLEVANRDPRHCHGSDLGFSVAPRLNAAGRLKDMALGIECLLADDMDTARRQAQQLDELNRERRELQQDMQTQAEAVVHAQMDVLGSLVGVAALALFDESFHQGIVGLVAARLKDRLHRPVVVFAAEQAGSERLKGSARSIPGLHIRDLLAEIDAGHPGLIDKFGGHAMAAGLSLQRGNFQQFEQSFSHCAARRLSAKDLRQVIWTDGPLGSEQCTMAFATQLESLIPWGQKCPEPVFDDRFTVLDHRVVGAKHLKLSLALKGQQVEAIAFNTSTGQLPEPLREIRALYRLNINRFRGRESLQLIIEHIV